MTTVLKEKPKVIVIGIGVFGKLLVQLVHEKNWTLVGAYNRAGDKLGQDVGLLAGLDEPLGVLVEDSDKADFSGLDVDVALIAAGTDLDGNFPLYQKLFAAGINVLEHAAEAYSPYVTNADCANKIHQLAVEHGVTFTGGGIWDTTRFLTGIAVAGPCVEIDSIVHTSNTEIVRQGGTQYYPMLGVGLSGEDEYFDKIGREGGPMSNSFQVLGATVLSELGYTISGYDLSREPVIWDESVYCPHMDMDYSAGTVIGTRIVVDVHSEQGVTVSSRIEYRIFKPGEDEVISWQVNGRPEMKIDTIRGDAGLISAASLFNRVPDVMVAEPGIREIFKMPPLKPGVFL